MCVPAQPWGVHCAEKLGMRRHTSWAISRLAAHGNCKSGRTLTSPKRRGSRIGVEGLGPKQIRDPRRLGEFRIHPLSQLPWCAVPEIAQIVRRLKFEFGFSDFRRIPKQATPDFETTPNSCNGDCEYASNTPKVHRLVWGGRPCPSPRSSADRCRGRSPRQELNPLDMRRGLQTRHRADEVLHALLDAVALQVA